MEKTITPVSTKGVLIALLLIILALATFFLDLKKNSPIQWLSYVIFIGGIIWSITSYGKQINYNATFGNYFAHGFKVSALITAFMVIFIIVFIVLFPDFKEKAMDEARKAMAEKNNLTEEQINQALDISKKFFMVFAVGGTLLGYLIAGAIVSLIGAAVTKKQPNQFSSDINTIGQ